MKKLILLAFLLLATLSTFAQTQTTQSLEARTAITQLGDEINLKSDGTWTYKVRRSPVDYSSSSNPLKAMDNTSEIVDVYKDGIWKLVVRPSLAYNPPNPSLGTITVQIQAGVVMKSGDVKPVARTEFLVFGVDISPGLATFRGEDGKPLDIFHFYLTRQFGLKDSSTIGEMIKPAIAGSFTTNFSGESSFNLPLQKSPYYIFGSYDVGRSTCVWYLQINGDRSGSYIMDNKTSDYCS
jgi:hypothetical protein